MMICAFVKSPLTEPSFLISILAFPRTLPFTLPYTITSPAMMSAINFACSSDRQLPLIDLDHSFERAIDQEILVAGDFPFHMQARPQLCCRAVRYRSRYRHILVHLGCFLPRCPNWALAADSFAHFSVPG